MDGTTATPSLKPAPTPIPSLSAVSNPSPSTASFTPGPLAAGLFLALLAAAALVLARRRRRATRLIEILESASLGPKRALVVARLGDELLVLGSSEGGIALLSTRPAAGLVVESASCEPLPQPPRKRVVDLLSRLRPPRRPSPGFDALLTESLEDVELRRKLAAGLAGQVGRSAARSVS